MEEHGILTQHRLHTCSREVCAGQPPLYSLLGVGMERRGRTGFGEQSYPHACEQTISRIARSNHESLPDQGASERSLQPPGPLRGVGAPRHHVCPVGLLGMKRPGPNPVSADPPLESRSGPLGPVLESGSGHWGDETETRMKLGTSPHPGAPHQSGPVPVARRTYS